MKELEADLRNKGVLRWKDVMHLVRLLAGVTVCREGNLPEWLDYERVNAFLLKARRFAASEGSAW